MKFVLILRRESTKISSSRNFVQKALYSIIISTKSPTFCMITLAASLTNLTVPPCLSHVMKTPTYAYETETQWSTRTRLRALSLLMTSVEHRLGACWVTNGGKTRRR